LDEKYHTSLKLEFPQADIVANIWMNSAKNSRLSKHEQKASPAIISLVPVEKEDIKDPETLRLETRIEQLER
jgi:hypothetical protein